MSVSRQMGETVEGISAVVSQTDLDQVVCLDDLESIDPNASSSSSSYKQIIKITEENIHGVVAGITKDRKSVILWNFTNAAKPVTFNVSSNYGKIVETFWSGAARELMVVCSRGMMIRLSMKSGSAGTDLSQEKGSFGNVDAAAVDWKARKLLIAGDGVIKILAFSSQFKEICKVKTGFESSGIFFTRSVLNSGIVLAATNLGNFLSILVEIDPIGVLG